MPDVAVNTDSVLPDYLQAVEREAALMDFAVTLTPQRRRSRLAPVLISVIRDEMDHLPDFLAHHRRMGVQEFLIMDNGSMDEGPAYLAAQKDVAVIRIERQFCWQAKQGWITHAIRSIGQGRWFLVLDADERLIYAEDEKFDLEQLAAQMEASDIWRVRGLLVDLYGDGPLTSATAASAAWFDAEGYYGRLDTRYRSMVGGPRLRALASEANPIMPELTKYPLFRVSDGAGMIHPHFHWSFPGNDRSPCHLGLLHLKFTMPLARKLARALAEKNYWNDSAEYQAYDSALKAKPDLSLHYAGSARLRGADSLVQAGLIEPVAWQRHTLQRKWLLFRDRLAPKARLEAWRQNTAS